MIRFVCSVCGASRKVPDDMAGRKIKCQDCQEMARVPEGETSGGERTDAGNRQGVVISCPSCKQKLKVPDDAIGKAVKCPGCGDAIKVNAPATELEPEIKPAPTAGPFLVDCPACKQKLRAPEAAIGKTVDCPDCGSPLMITGPSDAVAVPKEPAEVYEGVDLSTLFPGHPEPFQPRPRQDEPPYPGPKWEYRVEEWDTLDQDSEEHPLNTLGAKGWELVSVAFCPERMRTEEEYLRGRKYSHPDTSEGVTRVSGSWRMVFKRKIL
jgi:DNA-directed RNA polymerase subunit RPC12/RpoP